MSSNDLFRHVTCTQASVLAVDAVALLTGAVLGALELNAAGGTHIG